MKSDWKQTAPDEIEIQVNPKPLLMLFGLPFLGIGLWMGYNVIGALWDVITRKVTLMDNIFGLTLLPVIAVAFLWPGVLMVLTRKRWVINGTTRTVSSKTSIVVTSWSRKYPLEGFKQVRAYQGKEDSRNVTELPSEEDHRRYTVPQPYCVDLVSADAKGSQTVGASTDPADAIQLAKAIADLTKLPLVDDTAKSTQGEEWLRIDVGPTRETS